jgi:hypothetical protein
MITSVSTNEIVSPWLKNELFRAHTTKNGVVGRD